MTMSLEVLHVPDCPNLPVMLRRLGEVTDLPVSTREIRSEADATVYGMSGSPTLLINGVDPFSRGGGTGLSCRIYRDERGQPIAAPSVAQLRDVLAAIDDPGAGQGAQVGVLSGWRRRARPRNPVDHAVHQQILRTFAATGYPPRAGDLDTLIVDSGRDVEDVLRALHEIDAIRLTPDGRIAVAYPFSAFPTRHRVRLGAGLDTVEVFAMCAIDALGISPMLGGATTRIDSVDPITGLPVTVTAVAGRTRWAPPTAVVFVGADPAGGPSADCCCDYLNFFSGTDAATTWMRAHPHVPGLVLGPGDAEALAARLFGPLLMENGG
jgi:hypothetical protein